jgi:hypothetical protein
MLFFQGASTVSSGLLFLSGSINVALLRRDGTRSAIVPLGGFEADVSSIFDWQLSNGAFACAFVEQLIAESTILTVAAARENGSAPTKSASFLSDLYSGPSY